MRTPIDPRPCRTLEQVTFERRVATLENEYWKVRREKAKGVEPCSR